MFKEMFTESVKNDGMKLMKLLMSLDKKGFKGFKNRSNADIDLNMNMDKYSNIEDIMIANGYDDYDSYSFDGMDAYEYMEKNGLNPDVKLKDL